MPDPTPHSTIIPGMRYHDAPAMIDFLQRAFGFHPHLVVPDDHGGIAHAQLTLSPPSSPTTIGGGMIMLGSVRDDDYAALQTTARQAGAVTGSAYCIVADVDAHCAQARAAGADIILEPTDQEYGGRLYSARDPEGQLWHFGSSDPWA